MSSALIEEDLAAILWGESPQRQYFARGLVRSVSDGNANVTVKGSPPIPLPALARYTPSAGDVVLVLMMPSGGVVIDKFG